MGTKVDAFANHVVCQQVSKQVSMCIHNMSTWKTVGPLGNTSIEFTVEQDKVERLVSFFRCMPVYMLMHVWHQYTFTGHEGWYKGRRRFRYRYMYK